ncbi:hypothetical protein GK047_12005 [Paenibacillus sp. SYP-B3998]|uniref:Uncharacterized protein n=1 Tax=Paenibacillus sp. SYP-B3998 TaxID=2678564 RepID=A0A6G3ZXG5_9BACL|nr:hypothetical protein [Paenibacillus sp. SYP-B3998]
MGCMIHRFDPLNDQGISVPIGVPADNVKLYFLDADCQPVPVLMAGELYIHDIARGYRKRVDLTD